MPTLAWREKNKDKLQKYRRVWYCNNKTHAKDKVRERKINLRLWFNKLKNNLKCEICEEDHIACLEFHHLNPKSKEINISKVICSGWSKEKILAEMEKCKVYCANCHRKYHYNDFASRGVAQR